MKANADRLRDMAFTIAAESCHKRTTPSESVDEVCCWRRGMLWCSSSNGGGGGEPVFSCLLDASLVRLLIGTLPRTAFA